MKEPEKIPLTLPGQPKPSTNEPVKRPLPKGKWFD